jgi:hypothetical protein
VLNQAAQAAGRSPQFAATYAAIAKRRGNKTATTAIARKLLTRACQPAGRPAGRRRRRAAPAAVTTGGAARPRVRSLQRHEPAPAPRPVI